MNDASHGLTAKEFVEYAWEAVETITGVIKYSTEMLATKSKNIRPNLLFIKGRMRQQIRA